MSILAAQLASAWVFDRVAMQVEAASMTLKSAAFRPFEAALAFVPSVEM